MIDLKALIKAGVYFGHRASTWSPRMKPYIWGKRGEICLIDVSKTARQMERAAKFLEEIVSQGQSVLWIGTKKPAQKVVHQVASELGDYYVTHRWIGGTLTNYSQVRKSVSKLLHYEDILAKADQFPYTKKERNSFLKMTDRLKKNIGGIIDLKLPLGAVVIVDVTKEDSALREAVLEKIPVIALVDTNSDPSLVDHVIPCNDDSPKAIEVVLRYLAQAVAKGKEASEQKKKVEKEEETIAKKEEKKASGKDAVAEKRTVKAKTEEKEPKASVKEEAPKKEAKVVKSESATTPKKTEKKPSEKVSEAKPKTAQKVEGKEKEADKKEASKAEEKSVAPKKEEKKAAVAKKKEAEPSKAKKEDTAKTEKKPEAKKKEDTAKKK